MIRLPRNGGNRLPFWGGAHRKREGCRADALSEIVIGVTQLFWYDNAANAADSHVGDGLFKRRNDLAVPHSEPEEVLVLPCEGTPLRLQPTCEDVLSNIRRMTTTVNVF